MSEIQHDLDAMRDALTAMLSIPTSSRRRIAFHWLSERVHSDIEKLKQDERAERVASGVVAVLGEP